MPKNKRKQNAYYFFMMDWKRREENKGRCFPNGLRDVQSDWRCSNAWKNLSDEEKAHYKEKEKFNKIQSNNDRKTCHGESVAQLQQEKIQQNGFLDNTKKYISSLIYNAKKNKDIQKLKFFVVHMNYYYGRISDNNEMDYLPAEIAIAEFSLEEGVTRTYHKIFRSTIQLGYAYEASEHSKNTHQIPNNIEFGEENYSLIYKEICDFLNPGRFNGKLPILFTRYEVEGIKYPVVSMLNTLSNFDKTSPEYFTIYSFEELFANLYNIISEENTNAIKFDNITASIKLKTDPFDYRKSIQCEFHKEAFSGGNHCSKSLVQRWIFVLFSYTFNFLEIDLRPGYHVPIEVMNGKQSELCNTFTNLSLNTPVLGSLATTKKRTKKEEKNSFERTYNEEQCRKRQSMATPIMIIDHSVINEASKNVLNVSTKKPQSLPLSTPYCLHADNVINLDDFPSLGRGCKNKGSSHPVKSKSIVHDLHAVTVIYSDEEDLPSLGRGCRGRGRNPLVEPKSIGK